MEGGYQPLHFLKRIVKKKPRKQRGGECLGEGHFGKVCTVDEISTCNSAYNCLVNISMHTTHTTTGSGKTTLLLKEFIERYKSMMVFKSYKDPSEQLNEVINMTKMMGIKNNILYQENGTYFLTLEIVHLGLYFNLFRKMDGTLDDFVKNVVSRNVNTTMFLYKAYFDVREQILELYSKHYVHHDVKTTNILYKHIDKNNFEFYLGDYGTLKSSTESIYAGQTTYTLCSPFKFVDVNNYLLYSRPQTTYPLINYERVWMQWTEQAKLTNISNELQNLYNDIYALNVSFYYLFCATTCKFDLKELYNQDFKGQTLNSSFTFEDCINNAKLLLDYFIHITGNSLNNEQFCYKFISTATSDYDNVYVSHNSIIYIDTIIKDNNPAYDYTYMTVLANHTIYPWQIINPDKYVENGIFKLKEYLVHEIQYFVDIHKILKEYPYLRSHIDYIHGYCKHQLSLLQNYKWIIAKLQHFAALKQASPLLFEKLPVGSTLYRAYSTARRDYKYLAPNTPLWFSKDYCYYYIEQYVGEGKPGAYIQVRVISADLKLLNLQHPFVAKLLNRAIDMVSDGALQSTIQSWNDMKPKDLIQYNDLNVVRQRLKCMYGGIPLSEQVKAMEESVIKGKINKYGSLLHNLQQIDKYQGYRFSYHPYDWVLCCLVGSVFASENMKFFNGVKGWFHNEWSTPWHDHYGDTSMVMKSEVALLLNKPSDNIEHIYTHYQKDASCK